MNEEVNQIPTSIDLLLGDTGVQLIHAETSKERLKVTWADNSVSEYPLLMLRDCCPCSKCFAPETNSRLTLFEQLLQGSTEVQQVNVVKNAAELIWSDGHESVLRADWLANRKLDESSISSRLDKVYSDVVDTAWTSCDSDQIIRRESYDQIVGNPEGIIEMIECLLKDGIFIIEDSPMRDCLAEFLQKIGAVHAATHYGPDKWKVRYNPTAKALPHSNKKLELHIDMPYLTKPCQLQMLRCQIQSKDGGENKFSDCLKACQILKRNHPDDYHILSTVEIDFQYTKQSPNQPDKQWFICNRQPLIQVEPRTGLPTLCRFAAEVRCSTMNQPIEVVERWWKAFRNYHKIMEDHAIFIKAKPGDIVAFNNGRIMHARESFDPAHQRELEGIYAEWDYLMSAWRMAKVKQQRAELVDQ